MLVGAPFLFVGLGRAPFDDPGEGMHAEIARELTVSRDPLRLTLNGVRYVDKPPLLYALMAGAFTVAGRDEASARSVSAFAALAASAATAWLGVRLLGPVWGFVGGVALLTSFGFFAYGRYVRPETLFVAALAAGFAVTLPAVCAGRRIRVAIGLGIFGLAALAKDPLGALLPPIAIGAALALAGRARPVSSWLPWPGVALALGIGLGWYALVETTTPGFAWYTVVDNHLLNVARARHFPDEDVPLSALQFLVVAVFGAAPWAVAAAATVWRLARARAWRVAAELPWTALALWALGVLVLTALSPFRLPHYGLPAYPALALLAARGWRDGSPRWLAGGHAVLFGAVAVACAVAWAGDGSAFTEHVMGATDVATRKTAAAGDALPIPPWEMLRPLVGASAVVCGAGAVLLGVVAGALPAARRLAVLGVVATLLAMLPSVAAGLALVSAHRAVKGVALEVGRRAAPGDVLVHEGPLENSGALEWYGGLRPVLVDGRRSVLGFGATRPEARHVFWDAERLRRAWAEGRVWVVTARAETRSAVAHLPGARLVASAGGRRLYVNR